MKLQHTSGAVIEDERLVETERSFNFYDPTCMLMAIYLKSDWQRVPEERWEKVKIVRHSGGQYIRVEMNGEAIPAPEGCRWVWGADGDKAVTLERKTVVE